MERVLANLKKILPRHVFLFLQPVYHFSLAWFAALFYGFPSRKLFVIGVTGTKGKTTVVELLHEILGETGRGAASISSLRFKVRDKEERNERKMTMPGRFFVQRFLHLAIAARCHYVILEVTSEGIKQFRHRFIKFDAAVMTNVAPEHIEAHGSFEKYLRAKLDLFWRLSRDALAVLNCDDLYVDRFRAATSAHVFLYGETGVEGGGSEWAVRSASITGQGIEFDIGGQTIVSSLLGRFNFYNILAAVSVGLNQHIPIEKIASAIERVRGIPGRLEFVQREPFVVIVDYAHTPDSLKNVYTFLREQLSARRMICVLGAAGGGRDKWKRPEFGKIAAEFCDEVILTDEDPYDEDPNQILSEIESGISNFSAFAEASAGRQFPISKILDRREAIRAALKLAKPGDTVICTGKGAESWVMGPHNTKIPWDERRVVREEFDKLHQYKSRPPRDHVL
ncbi:MAG: hypothetical protein A3C07_03920 [Candidatus Sungbacteria bacterium RIFCSPHIGHO2_02_FULL_47_11]|uniref:UDP-N-acetylmuramoyl-L-alanyl-D-glutamate--2, 6-diaminopimelate ligase n=1 Tax=Candidatus Sungbacteria bacterium RIFCSPHIGHO2_02_FULL_47_11 TaxID=1802270 RepID=A0A1G2KGL2_9BACT|nr:MAG: hypothetical protein A3C07_03920 [Candidatus Sungbacteria bacterium RIFCSPHIGHO2_02_FULL_47_11]